jgi:signal transduction histidine kinase/DNA-binding response OmpR family regulator
MYTNAQATRSRVIITTLVALIIVVILSVLLSLVLSASIVTAVKTISATASQLVAGQVTLTATNQANLEKVTTYQDEIGDIGRAFHEVTRYFKTVIEDIVQISQGLAAGNQQLKSTAEYRGDLVQIKTALESANFKLGEATQQNALQDWLKTGITQLNDQIRGDQEVITLAKNTIAFLTNYLNAQVGLFYLLKQPQLAEQTAYLQVIASYAYTADKQIPDKFQLGEGLIGEVAREKRTMVRTHTPEESPHIIQSGLAKASPRYIILLPILYENTIIGVLELGSTDPITTVQQDFLEQAVPTIGIAINTAESRTQMEQLLQLTQQQAREMQLKQAELQQSNEELQTQSEELQTQSEELQTQQEELQQKNDELFERTKELELQKSAIQDKNIALERAKAEVETARTAIETKAKELELASKYKSEFLANMSHELRTPLNSLLILSQLLADNKSGNLDDKQVEYAQTIHSAGSDLLTLINEILDLSKVEAGKIEVQIEAVFLPELIKTIEQKFQPLAQNKEITFTVNSANNLPQSLHTDAHRLKQIINNLLSNAFKFTSQGEVKLDIKRPTDNLSNLGLDASQMIAFSVVDSGIGIPKDKQQVIFEAFQQADGTTSRRYGGTGLGLSISRQLARRLGGEVHLQSEEGKGSIFTLYLPETPPTTPLPETWGNFPQATAITPAQQKTDNPTTVTTLENQSADKPLEDDREQIEPGDKTILIIEDDRKFARILMELGREKHFKCLVAGDGKNGLELAEQYQPQAIILDVGLPQIDGWTVMERLKDNPHVRHIPVHFMSASDHALEAKRMGAIGYLLKPVNMAQLGNAFKKIEHFLTQTLKNLLVITDYDAHQQQILELVDSDQVQTTLATTRATAEQYLQSNSAYDCVILDVDLEQHTGLKLLEHVTKEHPLTQLPVIIYANRELTEEEETILQQIPEQLTVKAVYSPERLLEETTLFLHQVEANLTPAKRTMLQMMHDKTAILKTKKVLIVDDDMRNLFALASILENHEMEVIVAKDGKEALELLAKGPPVDIILMDIMMPEMDGYEAMRQIRLQPQFRKLPLIALTAKAMRGDRAKCIEAGANDYLSKPVDTNKLISLMRVWLYR